MDESHESVAESFMRRLGLTQLHWRAGHLVHPDSRSIKLRQKIW